MISGRPAGPASWPRLRIRFALGLVLGYAAVSSARWLHHAAHWPAHAFGDEISANDRRFAELRPLLPSEGVVGYVGDPPPTGATPRDSTAAALLHFRRYLLAQYALAPALLVEGAEHELVVGNFEAGRPSPALEGLRVERNLGDGLVLFRREPR